MGNKRILIDEHFITCYLPNPVQYPFSSFCYYTIIYQHQSSVYWNIFVYVCHCNQLYLQQDVKYLKHCQLLPGKHIRFLITYVYTTSNK